MARDLLEITNRITARAIDESSSLTDAENTARLSVRETEFEM